MSFKYELRIKKPEPQPEGLQFKAVIYIIEDDGEPEALAAVRSTDYQLITDFEKDAIADFPGITVIDDNA